eukprot:965954-Rhodomonas_salina.1
MEEAMWGSAGRSTVTLLAPAPLSLPSHPCSPPVSRGRQWPAPSAQQDDIIMNKPPDSARLQLASG